MVNFLNKFNSMAHDEKLANRIRESLMHLPNVEEKTMFQSLAFMVDQKLCIGVKNQEIMCRIDPDIFENVLEKQGCRPMIHGNRTMKGYVFIDPTGYTNKEDFDFWVGLALEYNPKAKSSKKKKSWNYQR